MSGLPKEIADFNNAILRFVAVEEVSTAFLGYGDLQEANFSLPGQFGDIPHALFSRTDGAMENEVWGYTEFRLTSDAKGWLALEYLSWWVRDQSRSGVQIQMRPMAMPPFTTRTQLGETLRFLIDHIVVTDGETPAALIREIGERAKSLNQLVELYSDKLSDLLRS